MHLHAFAFALAFARFTAAQNQRRGFMVRPGRVEPETPEVDSPSPPTYHSMGDGVSQIGSTTNYGDLGAETVPQYEPAEKPNECLKEACLELSKEIAEQLLDVLQNAISSSSSTTTAQHKPLATAFAAAPPMANYDVARSMTLDQESLALFDAEEQNMYFRDRICFYANVEQRYASAAAATPAPTRLALRDVIDDIQSQQTADVTATPLASGDVPYYQRYLWQTQMPNQLVSIYAPVWANTSMATATTTCSGLGSAPSITATFVHARESTRSPTPTPITNSNMSEGAGSVPTKAEGSAIFGAIVAFVALITL